MKDNNNNNKTRERSTRTKTIERRGGDIESTSSGMSRWNNNDLTFKEDNDDKNRDHRYTRTKTNMIIVHVTTLFATFWFVLGYSLRNYIDVIGKMNGQTTQTSNNSQQQQQQHLLDHDYIILRKPNKWETFSHEQISDHFDCDHHALDSNKPLPSQQQWEYMRKKYNAMVDDTVKFSDDIVPPTIGYTLRDHTPPPFYANYIDHGDDYGRRGVFASRNTAKGWMVHDGARSAVSFPDDASWRRYVFALPPKMACDVVLWSRTQARAEGGTHRIFVDLTIAAFFNGGPGEKYSNVSQKVGHSLKFFATRNIRKDSELIYNSDMYTTDWKKVGL